MNKPIVAIVGRPNVGKSTLFNRIIGERFSIVESESGITRDRIYSETEWLNQEFIVIDTGGLEFEENDTLQEKMIKQADMALDEADVIIFVVDIRAGITPSDRGVANYLRQKRKPVILAANKAENHQKAELDKYDFYELGLGEPLPISGQHGLRIGDLLDEVIDKFPTTKEVDSADEGIKFAVAGRPNVGKSSLVNKILGEKRVIVSEEAGTTRDAIDTYFSHEDKDYTIIDTAGMRKKGRVNQGVEKYSVIRSLRAIDRSDIVLLVIDAEEGLTEQDKRIAGYAEDAGRGIILVVNKWDLIEKNERTMDRYVEEIRARAGFLNHAPMIFVSALTGKRVLEILDIVNYVAEQYSKRVKTNKLNSVVNDAVAMSQPPTNKHGKKLKIYYATQPKVRPPVIVLFVNNPDLMHFSYKRYLENQIRKTFGFEGTPIRIVVRERGN